MHVSDERFSETDADTQRDKIVRAMIAMPPAPKKPTAKKKQSRPKPADTKTKKKPTK